MNSQQMMSQYTDHLLSLERERDGQSAVSVWREPRRAAPARECGQWEHSAPVTGDVRSRDSEFVLVLRSAGRSAAGACFTHCGLPYQFMQQF